MRQGNLLFRKNLSAMLSYCLGPLAIISGLFFFVTEEKEKLVWFHGLQAVFFSLAWFMAIILLAGIRLFAPPFMKTVIWVFWLLVWIFFVINWVRLLINAYRGNFFRLPVIGRIALENAIPPEKKEEDSSPPENAARDEGKGRTDEKTAGSGQKDGTSRESAPGSSRKKSRPRKRTQKGAGKS